MAADHNNLKLTFKQEVMEDTKLWLKWWKFEKLRLNRARGGARWALPSPPSTFCTSVEHAFLGDNFVAFHRQCKQKKISQSSHSNLTKCGRNLVQISFNQWKHQIKSWKKESERAWSPCALGSFKAGIYCELWRHRIPRLRADKGPRENAWELGWIWVDTIKYMNAIHLKILKTDYYIWLSCLFWNK